MSLIYCFPPGQERFQLHRNLFENSVYFPCFLEDSASDDVYVVVSVALASIGPFREEAISLRVRDSASDNVSVLVETVLASIGALDSASDDASVLVAAALDYIGPFPE